jgi:hypothetical protein
MISLPAKVGNVFDQQVWIIGAFSANLVVGRFGQGGGGGGGGGCPRQDSEKRYVGAMLRGMPFRDLCITGCLH